MEGDRDRILPLSDRCMDGRRYEITQHTRTGFHLRCHQGFCRGTAKFENEELEHKQPHSEFCLPDHQAELIGDFKKALKDSLTANWYQLRMLFDTTILLYPEVAPLVTFRGLTSYMMRCRRILYPARPLDLQEFSEQLEDPVNARTLQYSKGHLSTKFLEDGQGGRSLVLYDAAFVAAEIRPFVTKLFVDATFKSRPNINEAYPLLTVMGITFNHGIPFIWVIMSRKLQTSYETVFRFVKDEILPGVNVQLVMTDFECALRNAVHQVYPEAICTGCNTHYDRALLQKLKTLRLQAEVRQDPDGKLLANKIMVLAYLPADMIARQYSQIKNSFTPRLRTRFRPFFAYYERYWLGIVTPTGYSVFGLSRRTNNISESYNARLGHMMQSRPSPWDFIKKVVELQNHAFCDVNRLKRNPTGITRHGRYLSVHKNEQLQKAWKDLYYRAITVDEFIIRATHLKGNCIEKITIQSDVREGPDFELTQAPRLVPTERDPDYEGNLFAADAPGPFMRDLAPRPPQHVANAIIQGYVPPLEANVPDRLEAEALQHDDAIVPDRLEAEAPQHEEANVPDRLDAVAPQHEEANVPEPVWNRIDEDDPEPVWDRIDEDDPERGWDHEEEDDPEPAVERPWPHFEVEMLEEYRPEPDPMMDFLIGAALSEVNPILEQRPEVRPLVPVPGVRAMMPAVPLPRVRARMPAVPVPRVRTMMPAVPLPRVRARIPAVPVPRVRPMMPAVPVPIIPAVVPEVSVPTVPRVRSMMPAVPVPIIPAVVAEVPVPRVRPMMPAVPVPIIPAVVPEVPVPRVRPMMPAVPVPIIPAVVPEVPVPAVPRVRAMMPAVPVPIIPAVVPEVPVPAVPRVPAVMPAVSVPRVSENRPPILVEPIPVQQHQDQEQRRNHLGGSRQSRRRNRQRQQRRQHLAAPERPPAVIHASNDVVRGTPNHPVLPEPQNRPASVQELLDDPDRALEILHDPFRRPLSPDDPVILAELPIVRARETADDSSIQRMCVICLTSPPTYAFPPCGHRCCCEVCQRRQYYDEELGFCPLCMRRLERSPVRIWVQSGSKIKRID